MSVRRNLPRAHHDGTPTWLMRDYKDLIELTESLFRHPGAGHPRQHRSAFLWRPGVRLRQAV
ncbi:hypothetical protein MJ560_23550 [Klebsiella pneumoniae]|nr:hypothetical protein MJ560_23550 [Klebsiella pneumoniae]